MMAQAKPLQHETWENRPKIDWSMFRQQAIHRPKPVIYTVFGIDDDSHTKFRSLAQKVARRCYDIPDGHSIVAAYQKTPGSSEVPSFIGAITFKIGDRAMDSPRKAHNFMDDFYHKVSFLFVDRQCQRIGVGTKLMQEAFKHMGNSGVPRPVRLEGAKSAFKFFSKMGFVAHGKVEESCSRKGSRLFWKYYYMQHPILS